jgi:hypothetical protein
MSLGASKPKGVSKIAKSPLLAVVNSSVLITVCRLHNECNCRAISCSGYFNFLWDDNDVWFESAI